MMTDVNEKPILTYRLYTRRGCLVLEQKQDSGHIVNIPVERIKHFSNSGMDDIWEIAEQNEFYEIMAVIKEERERRIKLDIVEKYNPPFKQ